MMQYSKKQLNKTSKFLSYVLRHKPSAIGLQLDNFGWALISELIDKAEKDIMLNQLLIEKITSTNNKKRFQISDDGLYIRANQGHSIKVDLQLIAKIPPTKLFHGTATRFLESIQKQGLKSGQRHHVHLSVNIDTAISVGRRHGNPIILEVDAGTMHQQGYAFFLSNNNIWLTEYVPPQLLKKLN